MNDGGDRAVDRPGQTRGTVNTGLHPPTACPTTNIGAAQGLQPSLIDCVVVENDGLME